MRVNQGICTVIVQDNGVGISPEDRPHVFERFYTADKAHTSGKGTGLGLSFCQRIMEMHGQKITLMDTSDERARRSRSRWTARSKQTRNKLQELGKTMKKCARNS